MHREQVFQTACILAAIAVPLLVIVADTTYLAKSIFALRVVAIAGNIFLCAALIGYIEIIFNHTNQGDTFRNAVKQLSVTHIFILLGILCLVTFQLTQNWLLF